jgi:hypothetical protein
MDSQAKIPIGTTRFDSEDELDAWGLFRQAVAHLANSSKVTIAFATRGDVPDGVWLRVAELASREGLDAVVNPVQIEIRRPEA